jgi:hypothetical protein
MSWSFAIVNNKLAEIYFEKRDSNPILIGHCYVKESEYTTKKEKAWIKRDTSKYRFTYRKGEYKLVEMSEGEKKLRIERSKAFDELGTGTQRKA